MRASHDTIVVQVVESASGAGDPRAVVVPAGTTLHELLVREVDCEFNEITVTVNGRSVSRLTPLLPHDHVRIAPAAPARPTD